VERAAAGEAPSSPQPPEAGARRARLYGALSVADHRNRETLPSNWCGAGLPIWDRSSLADFEHDLQAQSGNLYEGIKLTRNQRMVVDMLLVTDGICTKEN
jgi:hypothetical protein